ncbi:hypothetical protein FHX42_004087 [Saccharopolyspora lacisalsi]|uniref:DUF742 domain-containing protein n=1 Tax=Halosaccharopolyspora lacisalsi TaxID=1000566 RepID=A0A839E760_9PSEU|nr:DUF742 domain-containing protein [Halosaccharopolyspora lacisalsi]MBA8826708.1 hypothetical protein [Halosaccharopolyspora lacisalsi]
MTDGADPSWDGDLFRLYSRRSGADSWQDDFVDDPRAGGRSSGPPHDAGARPGGNDGDYDRGLFGGPGADLFGSEYSSEQSDPGRSRGGDGSEGGPLSMPSISQPMSPISQSMPSISGSMPALSGQDGGGQDDVEGTGSLMRPYARTRGRTRTDYDLAIETLVTTSERGRTQSAQSSPEHRSICGLCTDARSVAEISAHLRLPLGVVRVLIGDMAGLGLVQIHDSGMVVGDRPSMEFLERVLSGLRRL